MVVRAPMFDALKLPFVYPHPRQVLVVLAIRMTIDQLRQERTTGAH
jgi:hypothetical protein